MLRLVGTLMVPLCEMKAFAFQVLFFLTVVFVSSSQVLPALNTLLESGNGCQTEIDLYCGHFTNTRNEYILFQCLMVRYQLI